TNTNRLPDNGSSSNTLITTPTNPSMDFRKSTGLLYARIRRTSGVNHILLSSHPQAHPVRKLHLHGPRLGTRPLRLALDKAPLVRLAPPLPPVPLLKRPQGEPFLRTKLPCPHPTLSIPRNNPTPLHRAALHMPIALPLHDSLLLETALGPLVLPVAFLSSRASLRYREVCRQFHAILV